MSWFKRKEKGIITPTKEKKEAPDGLWYQCPECKKVVQSKDHSQNLYTCPGCGYHARIGSKEYFEIIFDNNEFQELDTEMISADPLKFQDTKSYPDRVKASQKKTKLKDALRSAHGKINGLDLTVACMDFSFIGG